MDVLETADLGGDCHATAYDDGSYSIRKAGSGQFVLLSADQARKFVYLFTEADDLANGAEGAYAAEDHEETP